MRKDSFCRFLVRCRRSRECAREIRSASRYRRSPRERCSGTNPSCPLMLAPNFWTERLLRSIGREGHALALTAYSARTSDHWLRLTNQAPMARNSQQGPPGTLPLEPWSRLQRDARPERQEYWLETA